MILKISEHYNRRLKKLYCTHMYALLPQDYMKAGLTTHDIETDEVLHNGKRFKILSSYVSININGLTV